MKNLRVLILVVIMMTISTLSFMSTGEVMPESERHFDKATSYLNIQQELDQVAALQQLLLAKKPTIELQPQLTVMSQEYGVKKYQGPVKETLYNIDRDAIYQEALTERVQIILDLTPLDEETAKIVLEYSDRYNIRPSLILGVMDLESNFTHNLVGTSQDRGYMQIIPGTERWLARDYGEELGLTYDPSRIFEAEYNIPLAVKYLSVLQDQYKGNTTKMLTSYNRGDGGLRKWYAEHGTYETAYSRVVLKRELKYLKVK